MNDKVIPLEELGKRGTLTLYNQAYVEELKAQIADLEKENTELKEVHESDKRSLALIAKKGAELELKIKKLTQHLEPQSMSALFEQVEKEVEQEQKIKELEKKISILLSCKNCPNNKGGLLCQKEYEDKCLAQKIQYIKELKEEIDALANVNIKAQNIIGEAKDIIRNLLRVTYGEGWNYSLDWKVKAEDFLKENEIKC